ncbi:MAG: FAD-dependent oxidoreductase [Gammaproteobacteria bacterium]|nr:FAD-dependent oxidoreductase [Gammaproteobacteria bacterium]
MKSSEPEAVDRNYRKLSYWLDSVPGSLAPRESLDQDIEVDVAIAGAGYTGLWTAYYLKQLKPDLSIAIIESEIAGFGASGRNGGWCSSYLSGIDSLLVDPDKAESAIHLQKLLFETVREVGRVAKLESIDCHFDQAGHVEVATIPPHLERVREEVDFMHELGFPEDDIRWLSPEQVRDHINIDGVLGGMFMPHCAAIHPARLARGLAEVLERQGVKIYEHSPVIKLDQHGLTSAGGKVKAGTTVLATEGYTNSIKGLERKLIPVHSMMIATEPLSESQLEQIGLKHRCTFNNMDHLTTYGQLTADKRIAFGNRGTYLYGSGIRTRFDMADPEFQLVWETLLRFFPSLRDSRFTHAWGGAMGVSRTLHPSVCYDRERQFGWAGGYFGNGVGATNLAGRTMADLILERETDRIRTPWVNPPKERELDKKLWEIEPVRWFGIKTRAHLMRLADSAEYKSSIAAPLINKTMEVLFP